MDSVLKTLVPGTPAVITSKGQILSDLLSPGHGLWVLVSHAGISPSERWICKSRQLQEGGRDQPVGHHKNDKFFPAFIPGAEGTWWAVWQDVERAFVAQQREVAKNHDLECASGNACAIQGGSEARSQTRQQGSTCCVSIW